MRQPRLFLSSAPAGFTAVSTRAFDKSVLRVGRYVHPVQQWTLDVDRQRLDRMVSTFNLMRTNGVTVDVTVDHSTSARGKLGRVIAARREGDELILTHEFADDEGSQLARRNGEVSVEIEPELLDGHGRRYADAIVASSIVRQPVVPGQGPFVKIAASRGPGAAGIPFALESVTPSHDAGCSPGELDELEHQVRRRFA